MGFSEIFQALIEGSTTRIYAAWCYHCSAVSGAYICRAIVDAPEITWIA